MPESLENPRPVRTLLVANRGEIACRVIRTAKRLGIRTVAVFSEADRGAAHVAMADDAVSLGATAPAESYLNVEAVLSAAKSSGADAIHPGYGFLSEDADFASAVEGSGLAFVGPTPDALCAFGDKHTARAAAVAAGVPVFAGTGLLPDADTAVTEARAVGYPVMLKATGGGGGIGMSVCRTDDEVRDAYESVVGLAMRSFGSGGVFAERYVENARHVEVQVFGDGAGRVVSLGDRDCSLQRRNQKVVEEAPAPALPDEVRTELAASARRLASSMNYRSAGTVEFVYDPQRGEASFLEVNARLQVEHPVTEAVTGVDLVEWMLRAAGGDTGFLAEYGDEVPVAGHAVEARVYAEDPAADFRPSAGVVTCARYPSGEGVRVDSWARTGTDVPTAYDPLLAKVIVTGADRTAAVAGLADALADTRIDGIEVNLGMLRAAVALPAFAAAEHTTRTLVDLGDPEPRITVARPGLLTTVQDADGRVGYWQVGVPPSGAMDDRSLRLANRSLGNDENAPGLECTSGGPELVFSHATWVCVAGAPATVTVDGGAVAQWEPVLVPEGARLSVGEASAGLRTCIAFAGGLDVPDYLGSAATFTLGKFGGHGGRALRPGDVLRPREHDRAPDGPVDPAQRPSFPAHWELTVAEGPHGAPEFFTRSDIETLYASRYEVHFNSARTGVRLVGPKPEWARRDGGEAGLHPSNIHDNAYSIGALDFTGDTPILLGPDGPSLGGFVCPVTVVTADRWKLGQLRPGDTLSFVPATDRRRIATAGLGAAGDDGVLRRIDGEAGGGAEAPAVTYRRQGDDAILVEYGDIVLDLALRARVHALHTALAEQRIRGILDLTPGIRSLQVHVDPDVLSQAKLLDLLIELEHSLPAARDLVVPSREVRLPLSWDDPATREAIERYMAGVRDDAPWCPWNIEFIRRINGLDTVDDVYRTVFDASYLVLGLGDVYLGAPVATPLDPRHRLVTTKYNPARTWTAENSVGIGGAYLCVYGMEGPGGYQFVGRTTQVWRTHPRPDENPWLLRFFDRISWYPVSPDELLDMRADVAAGRRELEVTEGSFSLAEHERFLADNAASIAQFRERQSTAFEAERQAWERAGEFDRAESAAAAIPVAVEDVVVPDGGVRVDAPFTSNVWKVDVAEGDTVEEGQQLVVLEAMKMETAITAPASGVVTSVAAAPAAQVDAGDPLVVLGPVAQ
ncbi:urea carboxylase [Rhodococcus rhodnii]|uniref:biotin carboxylase n=2 Tax=Rhodococcus rhodnii TaxID=38312 RepID=R7WRM9_9NOCA|nr:urea carboxylase [Rhodococcus rhodnii]EOM76624.1 urea carboxylase [Rhodococcus rhodnii LMG 5362]TXG89499.1 urea carboxylase [Rhodococcus rhodnii]